MIALLFRRMYALTSCMNVVALFLSPLNRGGEPMGSMCVSWGMGIPGTSGPTGGVWGVDALLLSDGVEGSTSRYAGSTARASALICASRSAGTGPVVTGRGCLCVAGVNTRVGVCMGVMARVCVSRVRECDVDAAEKL